jgi:hypothetical protein
VRRLSSRLRFINKQAAWKSGAPGGLTTVAGNLILVNLQHFFQTQKIRFHRSLRQVSQSSTIFLVGVFLRPFELLPSRRIPHRRNQKHLPIRRDFERRFMIDFQEIENRTVDYERQRVPMPGEFLDHAINILDDTL